MAYSISGQHMMMNAVPCYLKVRNLNILAHKIVAFFIVEKYVLKFNLLSRLIPRYLMYGRGFIISKPNLNVRKFHAIYGGKKNIVI